METSDRAGENEDSLIKEAGRGDAGSFGRLYDLHVDRIYRHIYYRVGNVHDAEDLTQQVFLNAWRALPRYKRTESPFIAWLMVIAHNLVINYYRARKHVPYPDAEVEAPGKSVESVAEAHFDQERLHRAIMKLGKEQQMVIVLRFIEGFEYSEIAALLGKSEGAVRVIQHRALAKLRSILEKERD